MLAYRSGNLVAFETLYRRHKDPLWRYLLRGSDDREAVAEMFQDVWAGVVRGRENWQPRAKFTTWLYTLAHHRLVDFYRLRRLSTVPIDDTGEGVELAAPEYQGPDADARNAQLRQRLSAVLAQLPLEQRQAFLLKEEGGLSLEEIGEATGVGRETVKSRLRYALVKLRQELSDVWP